MERQYRDSSNLSARVALQARFSTNTYGWQRWVFDRIELPSEALLLELGCGVGLLWRENLDRVPAGWSVTLTDASPGMLGEAERELGAERRFRFRVVHAQEIPFEDGVFDAVVANHMLYHVQDLPRALSEIARILKPGGSLYATTVGRHHMREMGKMLAFLDPTHPPDEPIWYYLAFNLENGAEQLSRWFAEVSLVPYEDALACGDLFEHSLLQPEAVLGVFQVVGKQNLHVANGGRRTCRSVWIPGCRLATPVLASAWWLAPVPGRGTRPPCSARRPPARSAWRGGSQRVASPR